MPFDISPHAAAAMLVFIAVSVVVGAALTGAGGWRSLAERYPGSPEPGPDEERHRFTSVHTGGGLLGIARYNGCVTVGVSQRGISLALWAPFRLLHPPLFIPWKAVESCRALKRVGGPWTQVRVSGGGSLTVSGQAGAAISRHAAQRGLSRSTFG